MKKIFALALAALLSCAAYAAADPDAPAAGGCGDDDLVVATGKASDRRVSGRRPAATARPAPGVQAPQPGGCRRRRPRWMPARSPRSHPPGSRR